MAYSEYGLPGFINKEQNSEANINLSQYAGVLMVLAMAYALVIEKNIALFAILFLLLAITYNPTKIIFQGKTYDSEAII